MARRFKRYCLLDEQQAPPPTVTDHSRRPPHFAFLRLPTTPGGPLIIHTQTEIGGMLVELRGENLQDFGAVISIYGFIMQQ
jgi:hypothetical protein